MTQTSNIEAGVLHALKMYKIEKGMSDAAAEKWAATNLSAGVARVKALLDQHRDVEAGAAAAFADLKAWAQR